ncbi:hypothetical protein Salat_0668800, partial [Sesamum alatum]
HGYLAVAILQETIFLRSQLLEKANLPCCKLHSHIPLWAWICVVDFGLKKSQWVVTATRLGPRGIFWGTIPTMGLEDKANLKGQAMIQATLYLGYCNHNWAKVKKALAKLGIGLQDARLFLLEA